MSNHNDTVASACHADNATPLAKGIRKIEAESGGALHVTIVTAGHGMHLVAATMAGDAEAVMLLRAVIDSAAWIKAAPRNSPAICLCCPRRIRRVTSATVFGVVSPATPAPSAALGFAFCDVCAAHSDLMVKASEGLRRIWPDMRPVTVTHATGGRA